MGWVALFHRDRGENVPHRRKAVKRKALGLNVNAAMSILYPNSSPTAGSAERVLGICVLEPG
jgi:hypothetical protein